MYFCSRRSYKQIQIPVLHTVVQKHNKIIPALYKNTFKDFPLAEHSQMREYYKSEEQLAGLLSNADRGIIMFPLYRWGTWIFASAYTKRPEAAQ